MKSIREESDERRLGAGNRTGGATEAPSCQVISRRIAQCFGGGATRVRQDPGNYKAMMGTDLLKKARDVLNDMALLYRVLIELSSKRRTQSTRCR